MTNQVFLTKKLANAPLKETVEHVNILNGIIHKLKRSS